MGRGQKTCKNCQASTGPRAFKCPKCGQAFEFKSERVLSVPSAPGVVEKAVDWKTLQRGERFKVVAGSGPYWPAKKDVEGAEDINMGYHGKFTVKSVLPNGILAYGNKQEGAWATCFIYMGETKESESGLMRAPHKILKLKPKVKKGK